MADTPHTPSPAGPPSDALAETVAPATPAAADIDNPKVGDVLGGRYEILGELGRGAWGIVYRARDRVAEELVAIKLLGPRGASPEVVERLRRELRAARKVTHPGVVRIHDLIEIGGRLALSMELVEGETLADRLQRLSQLTGNELSTIAIDLARALAAAHRSGVTHRDLKPANILIRASNLRAVITDFGVSRLSDIVEATRPAATGEPQGDVKLTREGSLLGTPLYMAPEQLLGREVGPAADVYAYGVVLFEAATGRPPHPAAGLQQLLKMRLEAPAPPVASLRPNIAPEMARIIDRCLQVDPKLRLASGVELRSEFEAMMATGDLTGARLSIKRKLPWRRVGAALLLVAFAAGCLTLREWLRGRLPGRDRRVAFVTRNLGGADDAWLGQAIGRMARRKLTLKELRLRAVELADANVQVAINYKRTPEAVTFEAEAGPAGGRMSRLGHVSAASVTQALDALMEQVTRKLAAGQPEREPDDAERADMKRLGATHFAAWRLYKATVDDMFSSVEYDAAAGERAVQELLRLDPRWAHVYALIADGQEGSPRFAATLQQAREKIELARDPTGEKLLAAMALTGRAEDRVAAEMLDPQFLLNPDDVLLGWRLSVALRNQRRTHESIAVYQRLHELRPDLQFGANLESALRDVGRADEVVHVQEAWLEHAPDSEQALASQVVLDLGRGKVPEALKHARDIVLLHGASYGLATLCDVLIIAGQTREAGKVADEMLRGPMLERAWAWYRLGQIAILEGRFATAQETLHSAAVEGKPFGWEGESVHALEELRIVAGVVGRPSDGEKYTLELQENYRAVGMAAQVPIIQFERNLAQLSGRGRERHCPSLEPALAEVPDGPLRAFARRYLLRAAAAAGCAACGDVVKSGLASDEDRVHSLYQFGLCAAAEGNDELARDAFDKTKRVRTVTTDMSSYPSTFHSIMARFQLARVLVRLGRPAEARGEYEDFLAHWGHADRPIAEVAAARRELAAIK